MTTLGYSVRGPRGSALIVQEEPKATSLWQEVHAWVALLPILFITVGGRIQTESSPVAFRFTAMDEDSLSRRLIRTGISILILLLLTTRTRELVAACKRAKLLFLLPLIACCSTAWSQNPSHTLVDGLNLLLTTLFALYLYLRYPGQRLVSLLASAAFIALLLSVFAVAAFPQVGIDALQQDSWRGIFGQRNNCATVCTLYLSLGLYWRPLGPVQRVMKAAVISLSALFIIMSGSRTGWILGACALLLVVGLHWMTRMRSLERLLVLICLFAGVIFLSSFIYAHFNEVMALMDKDPTMTQRTVIWAEVIPSILKHPVLGYGYSSFWNGLNGESMQTVLTTGWMEGQAQDGYLDVLLQMGLVGLIPLLFVISRAFVQAGGAVQRRTFSRVSQMAVALLVIVLAENIGESSLLLPLGIPWFYALLALLILGARNRAEVN